MFDNKQNSTTNNENSENNKCIAEKAWDCVNSFFSKFQPILKKEIKDRYGNKSEPVLRDVCNDIDSILTKSTYIVYINVIISLISRYAIFTPEEYMKKFLFLDKSFNSGKNEFKDLFDVNEFKKELKRVVDSIDRRTHNNHSYVFLEIESQLDELLSNTKNSKIVFSDYNNDIIQSAAAIGALKMLCQNNMDKIESSEALQVSSSYDTGRIDCKNIFKDLARNSKNQEKLTSLLSSMPITREGQYNLLYLKEAEWEMGGNNDSGRHKKKLFGNIVENLDLYGQNTQKMQKVINNIQNIIDGENLIKDDIIRFMNDDSVTSQINFVISFLVYYNYEKDAKTTLTAKMALNEMICHYPLDRTGENGTAENYNVHLVKTFFYPIFECSKDEIRLNIPLSNAPNQEVARSLSNSQFGDGILDYDKQISLIYQKSCPCEILDIISSIKHACTAIYAVSQISCLQNDAYKFTDEDFIFVAKKLKESYVTPESIAAFKVELPQKWNNKQQKDFCKHFISIRKSSPFYSNSVNMHIRENILLEKEKAALNFHL